MKTIIKKIIFILILIPSIIYGQGLDSSYTFNNEVAQGNMISIDAYKLNTLWIGIDNPIKIDINGINSENITATIDTTDIHGSTIRRQGGAYWIAKVNPGATTTKIKVYIEKDGKKIFYGERTFFIRAIPNPIPVIQTEGYGFGFAEKNVLLANPYLYAILDGYYYSEIKFNVISFTFSLTDSITKKEIKCSGNSLNTEALELLKKSNKGDRITFFDIKVIGPDGITRLISSICLKID
jgi:hypothetical protein